MIERFLEETLIQYCGKGKAILLYGPRQAGKTTLINRVLEKVDAKHLYLSGDEYDVRKMLEGASSTKLRNLVSGYDTICIDEAQKINDIGNIIKLFTDSIPEVQVLATGSSSFELHNRTSESLTGRKYEQILLPFSFGELRTHFGLLEEKRKLEQRLVYGSYPEIVMKPEEADELIRSLVESYLYKDILIVENYRHFSMLEKLVEALAYQVGSEVSYSELSRLVGIDGKTVEKYLYLLEQAFIVFRLPAMSGNLRTEIRKGKKYYFYDNGVRNAIVGDLQPLHRRSDIGILWENYIVSERKKFLLYSQSHTKSFFWRTVQQQEVDYIERGVEGHSAWEIKWSPRAKVVLPTTFTNQYGPIETGVVHEGNYEEFLLPK